MQVDLSLLMGPAGALVATSGFLGLIVTGKLHSDSEMKARDKLDEAKEAELARVLVALEKRDEQIAIYGAVTDGLRAANTQHAQAQKDLLDFIQEIVANHADPRPREAG